MSIDSKYLEKEWARGELTSAITSYLEKARAFGMDEMEISDEIDSIFHDMGGNSLTVRVNEDGQ